MDFHLPLILNDYPTEELILSINPQIAKHKHMTNIALERAIFVFIRTRLCEAQNWRCCWCSSLMSEARNQDNSSTIEHIVPRSHRGSDEIENLAAACAWCNSRRKNIDAEIFFNNIEEFLKTKDQLKKVVNKKADEKAIIKNGVKFNSVFHKSHREKRNRRNAIKIDVIKALLKDVSNNPFEKDSKHHHFFEKYRNSQNLNVVIEQASHLINQNP